MTWISVSLLGLTGWQGYRLGREYGWWGRATKPAPPQNEKPALVSTDAARAEPSGLGRSHTDFDRLLAGYEPAPEPAEVSTRTMCTVVAGQAGIANQAGVLDTEEDGTEPAITEPVTTLAAMAGESQPEEYPNQTDQIPASCAWLEDESVSLVDEGDDDAQPTEDGTVELVEYVRRVRTVQRKLTELSQRRQGDASFVKHELGALIQTYQLDNDQSLDWLFQQQASLTGTDYGSLFDRIENQVN